MKQSHFSPFFFTTAPSECMNNWKHHITFPHFPLMFSTLVFLALLLLKQRLILCEHMINSWEHLTPSLQFFLTVVSFGGKLMTQLNFPLWVFLWGFCCYGAVRHVYEHAGLFGQISIPSTHEHILEVWHHLSNRSLWLTIKNGRKAARL